MNRRDNVTEKTSVMDVQRKFISGAMAKEPALGDRRPYPRSDAGSTKCKRPTNPTNHAYRLIFAREIECPLIGKLRSICVYNYGAYWS